MTTTTPVAMRLYVMARVLDYRAPWHDLAIDLIQATYPDVAIVPAKGRWPNSAAWVAEWPDLLPTLDAGVILTADAGIIGRGVYRECRALRDAGKPVAALQACAPHGYRWIPVPLLTLLERPTLNAYASVYGEPGDAPALINPQNQ